MLLGKPSGMFVNEGKRINMGNLVGGTEGIAANAICGR